MSGQLRFDWRSARYAAAVSARGWLMPMVGATSTGGVTRSAFPLIDLESQDGIAPSVLMGAPFCGLYVDPKYTVLLASDTSALGAMARLRMQQTRMQRSRKLKRSIGGEGAECLVTGGPGVLPDGAPLVTKFGRRSMPASPGSTAARASGACSAVLGDWLFPVLELPTLALSPGSRRRGSMPLFRSAVLALRRQCDGRCVRLCVQRCPGQAILLKPSVHERNAGC